MDALSGPVEVSPTDPRVRPLIDTHLELMLGSSPPESAHAMQAEDLEASGARFFAIFDEDTAVAMGALKPLDAGRGEIKSMHVRAAWRGGGLADRILSHLLAVAREQGLREVLLETGARDGFAAARAFYERHGFGFCAPFEGYVEDRESVFMSLQLGSHARPLKDSNPRPAD